MTNTTRIEEIKELIWSTWDTKEISDIEFNQLHQEIDQLYLETNNAECLWLISELHLHKLVACKRKTAHHALVALEKDYNNPGLHDNLSAGYSGCEVDFKKKNHHQLISFYYDFIKHHPDSLIARRILIENLIDTVYKDDYAICDGEEIKPYLLDKERLMKLVQN